MARFIGYHGTSKVRISRVKTINFFINSTPGKMGWLGKGAYFFEDNPSLAEYWANYKYNGNPITVLQCQLEADEGTTFDISNPNNQDSKDFHEAREELIQLIIEQKLNLDEQKKQFDGKVIDYICKIRGILLVRAFTYTYRENDRRYGLSSRVPNGIELCAKNATVIKSINIIS